MQIGGCLYETHGALQGLIPEIPGFCAALRQKSSHGPYKQVAAGRRSRGRGAEDRRRGAAVASSSSGLGGTREAGGECRSRGRARGLRAATGRPAPATTWGTRKASSTTSILSCCNAVLARSVLETKLLCAVPSDECPLGRASESSNHLGHLPEMFYTFLLEFWVEFHVIFNWAF